jgi:hypothetical protein
MTVSTAGAAMTPLGRLGVTKRNNDGNRCIPRGWVMRNSED